MGSGVTTYSRTWPAIKPAERVRCVKYAIRDALLKAEELERQGTKIKKFNIGDPTKTGYNLKMGLTDKLTERMVEAHLIDYINSKKYGPQPGFDSMMEKLANFYLKECVPSAGSDSLWSRAAEINLREYCPSSGAVSLRNKVAQMEGCKPDDVFVTEGLTGGIKFAFLTILDPGDKVLLPNPTYPIYITEANLTGANSVFYKHDKNGEIDIADLEKKIQGIKLMVIINPNNPLGSVYSGDNLRKVVELCARHRVPVFYDGAYDHLILEGKYVDFRKIAKGKIPFIYGSSVSKIYFYPGLRVGWLALHGNEWNGRKGNEGEGIVGGLVQLCNSWLAKSRAAQEAVAATLVPDVAPYLGDVKKALIERRDAVIKVLERYPFSFIKPNGAFYISPKVNGEKWRGKSGKEFADNVMRDGVLIVDGSGFGEDANDNLHVEGSAFEPKSSGVWFRMAILDTVENLCDAAERIGQVVLRGPR